ETLVLLQYERNDPRQIFALVVCGNDHQTALAPCLHQRVLTTSESSRRSGSPSRSSGTNASASSSAAANHTREATEMSTAALPGMAGSRASSAATVSSRTAAHPA